VFGTAEYGSTASSDWPGSGPRASARSTPARSTWGLLRQGGDELGEPGLCLTVYDEDTLQRGRGSGQVAGDGVLDVQRRRR
jgi:hypothetical protein